MLPEWILAVLLILTPIVVGALGVLIVHRLVSTDLLRRHNEVASPIHAAIGVMYAVLLAFVIVTVWEKHDDVDQAVATEANQVTGLGRDAEALPDPMRSQIRADLISYTTTTMTVEWDLMARGKSDDIKNASYEHLWKLITTFVPQSEHERTWLNLVYSRMNKLADARNSRLLFVETSVPWAMWGLLLACGLVTIVFSCFFGAERRNVHLSMVCSLSFVIGLMLYVIMAIDRTFVGIVRIEPEALKHALEGLRLLH
jgi:hypothetical protein